MKKLFYSSAYNVRHSEITEENVLDKLNDDIRSRMLGDVKKFVYATRSPLAINPNLFYVGGFYYEKEDPTLSPCENVVKAELDEIEEADVIMASLLKYSSIATVTEIIYAAKSPEKEIIIFCDPEITKLEIPYEYWFSILTAQRMNNKIQIVYVKNEQEILDFIKQYGQKPTRRIVIEGTDGVGKTTVVQKLRELGFTCLDREKTTISPCMVPEVPVQERAMIWCDYLKEHPNDSLIILTMKDQGALIRRIRNRGGIIDDYDRKAPMYDGLYRKTYRYLRNGRWPAISRIDLINVYDSESVEKLAHTICKSLRYQIPQIVVATNNAGKLNELRKIFTDYVLLGLRDVEISHEVIEDGATFLDNARKKALEISRYTQFPVIADDSGLFIDSLNGFPGVLTHRFLGDKATDEERNAELIRRAHGGTARFICDLVYYDYDNPIKTGHGELIGKIASSPRGKNGFGFDPIFELPDGRTLAEITPE